MAYFKSMNLEHGGKIIQSMFDVFLFEINIENSFLLIGLFVLYLLTFRVTQLVEG